MENSFLKQWTDYAGAGYREKRKCIRAFGEIDSAVAALKHLERKGVVRAGAVGVEVASHPHSLRLVFQELELPSPFPTDAPF